VLNKSEIFAILIQSKIFVEKSCPILILTCSNISSNPVYIRKTLIKHFTAVINAVWMSYLIRLSFFEIQSDPVLNCRIRLDRRDPETGSCSTLLDRQNRKFPPILIITEAKMLISLCANELSLSIKNSEIL